VTTLALTGSGEWDRDEQRALLEHIRRPFEPGHTSRHALRHAPPTVVLQRVDDRLSRARGSPADATHGTNEWRQHGAPTAGVPIARMPAASAAWRGQQFEARP